jgi:hypothetical protein
MPVSRPANERWGLSLCGAVLLGLIGLLRWDGYSLAVVKAERRELRGTVEHSAHEQPRKEASAQRLPEPDEPAAPLNLSRAGVNQGISSGDGVREQPSGHMEDRPRPVPVSSAAAGGDMAPRIFVHIRPAAQRKAA